MPKISYLVSTYDSDRYLDGHLANLLERQTDQDFGVVVVNPNSPGNEDGIARRWVKRDSRVSYIYVEERETYGASWLRAWDASEAEFVVNSNTDDSHHPRFTEIFHAHMSRECDRQDTPMPVVFGYSGLVVFDESGRPIGGGIKPPFDYELFSRECWAGPQVCWLNSEWFRKTLDWDLMRQRATEYKSAFDYWLWLYFMSRGFMGTAIPYQLTYYMQRASSIENSNKWENNYETYSAISEFFPHNLTTHLKHAKEFADFQNRPPRDEWVETMQRGKKWRK